RRAAVRRGRGRRDGDAVASAGALPAGEPRAGLLRLLPALRAHVPGRGGGRRRDLRRPRLLARAVGLRAERAGRAGAPSDARQRDGWRPAFLELLRLAVAARSWIAR